MTQQQYNAHTNPQVAVPSSPQPHMAGLGFPAPPMVPPIPPTLPSSCYAQNKAASPAKTQTNQTTGTSNPPVPDGGSAETSNNNNSELKQAPTSSGKLPPPQHTFPTPSELLSKLAAQDASDAREQRRQRRRKTKQEEAARTLGYVPTDPYVYMHQKKTSKILILTAPY